MRKQLISIGSKEFVALPSYGFSEIPAKVDTGADSSAIWASDIVEENGTLRFCLFGPGSRFYSGEPIEMSDYGIKVIRNSFGVSETRYSVKLLMLLGGKHLKVSFTLADRSRNRYPILIGKRTLAGRFLVDVSANHLLSDRPLRILVLNSKPTATVKKMFDTINGMRKDIHCDFMTYDDLQIDMGSTGSIDVMIIKTRESLRDYDLIYFKTYFKYAEFAAAIAEYAQMYDINFIDSEVAHYHARTKLSQYARLVRSGLPIPRTLAVTHLRLGEQFDEYVSELGLPFVLKDAAADKGESNFLIKNADDFARAVKQAEKDEAYYLAQKFIPNDGDFRFVVLDKNVYLVIERTNQSTTTHLTNTSKGAHARLVPLDEIPSHTKVLAVQAAIAMGREVAGVDLMQGREDAQWYVLEVNTSPQLASGAFVDEKAEMLAKFLKRYAEK